MFQYNLNDSLRIFNQIKFKNLSEIELTLQNYSLMILEVTYFVPDHPKILQTFIWQLYDATPYFPECNKFLNFWNKKIEAKIHNVKIHMREPNIHFNNYRHAIKELNIN